MSQSVLVSKEEVCPLNFVNADGTPMQTPPPGQATCNVQGISPWMGFDNKSIHFYAPSQAGVAFTITWKDQRGPGFVPDCSRDFVSANFGSSIGPAVQQ